MEHPIWRNHLPFVLCFRPPSLPWPSLLTPVPSPLMDQVEVSSDVSTAPCRPTLVPLWQLPKDFADHCMGDPTQSS